MQKSFPCKVEELPVIGEFILNSVEKDLSDFSSFSPKFNTAFFDDVRRRINACKTTIASSTITKELKATTEKLYKICDDLRLPLNKLEGYLSLAADNLDIAPKDFGIATVRNDIQRKNVEGIISNTPKLVVAMRRNESALSTVGLAVPEFICDVEVRVGEINTLNIKQNDLTSRRGRLTDENMALFNELWDSLQPILKTGTALYKGKDPVKLKDYTINALMRRVRYSTASKASKEKEEEQS